MRTLGSGVLAAAALGLTALSGCGGSAAGAPNAPAPGTEPLPKFVHGLPLTEPPVIASHGKLLKTTLVARNGSIEVGGPVKDGGFKIDNAMTYNAPGIAGGLLGPTLKVKPGDTIDITLDNELKNPTDVRRPSHPSTGVPVCPKMDDAHGMHHAGGVPSSDDQYTNLHFHGLHVTPRTRTYRGKRVLGDNVLADLGRGKHHIRFRIPKNHDRGTFWYHAHRHGCTDDQVFRGLAGVLLIGDVRTRLPKRFRHIRTQTLALRDIEAISTGGDSWAIPNYHDWGPENLKQRTVNGLVEPTISIEPGETQLWRVLNTSAALWYKVALVNPAKAPANPPPGYHKRDAFTIVARDGNPATRPQTVRSWVIAPGNRIDILVRGPQQARKLVTLPFDQGRNPPTPTFPKRTLARVAPSGAPEQPLAGPGRRARLPRFPRRRGPTRRFVFSFKASNRCGKPPSDAFAFINGCAFSDKLKYAVKPHLGTTEKWVLINKSPEWHPFHIHQNDFRVISINGTPIRHPRGDQDTVGIPPIENRVPGRVVILMPFQRFSGDFVFHCHILDHEDGGMMKRVHVVR